MLQNYEPQARQNFDHLVKKTMINSLSRTFCPNRVSYHQHTVKFCGWTMPVLFFLSLTYGSSSVVFV